MKQETTFSFWVVFLIVVLLFIGAVLLVYRDTYTQAGMGSPGKCWQEKITNVFPPEPDVCNGLNYTACQLAVGKGCAWAGGNPSNNYPSYSRITLSKDGQSRTYTWDGQIR